MVKNAGKSTDNNLDWCFDLSDKLEDMTILTQKIYAVAEKLLMDQSQDTPFTGILFDYALDALGKADGMRKDYCEKLLSARSEAKKA